MVWVIVKVYHGDADKVLIETRETRDEMLSRITDLIEMVKENDDEIIQENDSYECEYTLNKQKKDPQCEYDERWWNITFKSGLLVTIDAKLI